MARTQGSFLLAQTGHTQEVIAATLGVSRQQVGYYVNGEKKPGPGNRKTIERVYQIPAESWDQPKVSQSIPPPPKSPSSFPGVPVQNQDVFTKAARLEAMAESLIDELENDVTATRIERTRVMTGVANILATLAKMTGQFDIGAKFLKTPIWKRIERAVAEGLEGHPEAACDVRDALRRAERDISPERASFENV